MLTEEILHFLKEIHIFINLLIFDIKSKIINIGEMIVAKHL